MLRNARIQARREEVQKQMRIYALKLGEFNMIISVPV
jgi:hypothetical protein